GGLAWVWGAVGFARFFRGHWTAPYRADFSLPAAGVSGPARETDGRLASGCVRAGAPLHVAPCDQRTVGSVVCDGGGVFLPAGLLRERGDLFGVGDAHQVLRAAGHPAHPWRLIVERGKETGDRREEAESRF